MMMMTTLPTKATQTKLFGRETITSTTTTAIAKKETNGVFFSYLQPGGVNASGSSFQPSPANDCCKIFSQLSAQMKCLFDRKHSRLNWKKQLVGAASLFIIILACFWA